MYSIAHKVELYRNIFKMYREMPDIYNFHPRTFLLPHQYMELKNTMLAINDNIERTFIIKPDRGAQGKGIFLIQDPDIVANIFIEGDGAVAQQYIKPFLIDGLKFDLRIYVLVTSVDPLRIYIHKEGMARFCTEAYEDPNVENLDHCYSHLTIYSLNKQNDHFNQSNLNKIHNYHLEGNKSKSLNKYQDEKSDSESEYQKDPNEKSINYIKKEKNTSQVEEENVFSINQHETPFKRSLSSIMHSIRKSGKDADQLQSEIDDIIRFTMASIQPFLSSSYHSVVAVGDGKCRCFEILGFDILIGHDLRPWLLEVNFMPSLTTNTEFDRILKYSVIKGALKIVDIKPDFKKQLKTRQKSISQGKKKVSLYDPEIESKIARENTNWRQLLPLEIPSENSIKNSNLNESNFDVREKINLKREKLLKLKSNYEKALMISKNSPLGAAAATSASKAKMAATQNEIFERQKKFRIPQTVRNRAVILNNPLPPLHEAHSACFDLKSQQLNSNQHFHNENQTRSKSMNINLISKSNSGPTLKYNIGLNPKKTTFNRLASNFIKDENLKSSINSSFSKSKHAKLEENNYSDKSTNYLQKPLEMIEVNTTTSSEMPLYFQFSGAKPNLIDIFEEEKRINILSMRLEEEKSLGIIDSVYSILGIKLKKEPILKSSIISKRITKPVVAFRQIFNEKIVI